MIADQLAGKTIAITGTTGFLGTAVVERLLRGAPDCKLVLLVRPGRRGAHQRVQREILKNDCFDRLRDELGSKQFDAMAAERVIAVAADIGTDGLSLGDEGRSLLAGCHIVIHSAATVSFDSEFDHAVEVNLLGPVRIAETLHSLGVTPHFVGVSTCYVAGNRKGPAPEELLPGTPFDVKVDWTIEVEAARRRRTEVESASRTPEQLAVFAGEARSLLGAAGTAALASRGEQQRERWVSKQMTAAGRARASSLGFPDAYAFTKAMGERALIERRGDIPVSIVRPSIIESAWAEPFPGWIRGFRMAEPILINFGKGLLSQFPGNAEGIVDVIPVDIVVAAIVATAAKGPSDEPEVFHVASGMANPFRYSDLVELAAGWFAEHPIYDELDQPISPPTWRYREPGAVPKELARAKQTLDRASRALAKLPLRGKQAQLSGELEERRDLVERALEYVELYGAYTSCEAVYQTTRLAELHHSLDPADQASFCADPAVIDWREYVQDIHLPSVMKIGRVKTAPSGKGGESRSSRLRKSVLSPERELAAFDLENTLIASNVVASYGWLAKRRLDNVARAKLVARTLAQAPRLLALDRADRTDFLRSFYRRYDGAAVDQIDEDALEMFSDLILTKSFPAAIRRVREHQRLGHRTVLITGALDFVVEPLEPLFDDIVAPSLMTTTDGRYTGRMADVPPTGETRAQALRDYAAQHGIDLTNSVAYADSTSDLPMLDAVGFPVAVNPETKLASLARRRGWLVEIFDKSPGGPLKVLPIGARRTTAHLSRAAV